MSDLAVIVLEGLDLHESSTAGASASVHKGISIVDPLETADTDGNVDIKHKQVLSEEHLLFIANQVHDMIVVTHD